MLKKFIPQKPMSSIGEGSSTSGPDESNRPAYSEQQRTPTTDHQKFMAEHSGKDILSSDVEIKGTIKFQKTIGENADIRGEIKTKSITVFGKVQGNITVSERCELKSKCTLQGDLKAARLVIEEGATFVGKSEVTSGMSVTAAKSSSSRPEIVRNDESAKPAFARA